MKQEEKVKRINELTDEVAQFHPFLQDLFSKIPEFTNVKYTHGTQENGADFVLASKDTILKQEEFIAVVAKTVKITKNEAIATREIIECFERERFAFTGSKKIIVNEVWVITSQSITKNAEEAIADMFKGKSLKFLDSTRIVKLIDDYYNDYWKGISASLSAFMQNIRIRTEEEDKRFNLIPEVMDSFYFEPEIVKTKPKNFYSKNKNTSESERIKIKSYIESERFVIVEAPMGYGKSKLIRELIKYYTDSAVFEEKKIIVVPIQYGALFENDQFNPKLLLSCKGLEIEEIEKAEKIIFFIDGLDEKYEDIDAKLENLKKLESYICCYKNYNVLVASREMNGLTDLELDDNCCIKTVEISCLSSKQIIVFLEKLCSSLNLKDRILEDIKKTPLLKEIPQSPIAAILLAKIFEENYTIDLPSNLPELYIRYFELVLGKWDRQKEIASLQEYSVVKQVLYLVANYFIDNQCTYITNDEYNKILSDYLSERNLLNIGTKRIDYIITKRAGILVKSQQTRTLVYSHRSFIEFLYAEGKSEKGEYIDINERVFDLAWSNIFYFYIGIKKDCPELLMKITEIIPESEAKQWLKVINLSNFYLAATTTPYRFFQENLYKIILECTMLYRNIIKAGNSQIFGDVPVLVMLWWVQYLIKENYSYEFFKKAIVDTVLRIDDLEILDETKIYAIFFLAILGLGLKEYEPFHFLLKKYKDKLPDDIVISMFSEIKSPEVKIEDDDIVASQKWLDRKIRKMHPALLKELSGNSQ